MLPSRARTTTVARLKSIENRQSRGTRSPVTASQAHEVLAVLCPCEVLGCRWKRTLGTAGDLQDPVRPAADTLDGVEDLVAQGIPAQIPEVHLVLTPGPLHDDARTDEIVVGHDDARYVVWPSAPRGLLLVTDEGVLRRRRAPGDAVHEVGEASELSSVCHVHDGLDSGTRVVHHDARATRERDDVLSGDLPRAFRQIRWDDPQAVLVHGIGALVQGGIHDPSPIARPRRGVPIDAE